MFPSGLISVLNRVFFGVAFLLLGIAVVERASNLFGYTVVGGRYTAGRLLEFAAIMLLFVIALVVRTIREELRART